MKVSFIEEGALAACQQLLVSWSAHELFHGAMLETTYKTQCPRLAGLKVSERR